MNKAVFLIKESAREPYEVTFIKRNGNLSAYCTCPAGEHGQYCKHRFEILRGESRRVISDNKDEVSIVASWLPGSDIEEAMHRVEKAEIAYIIAKKDLSDAKRDLARAMYD